MSAVNELSVTRLILPGYTCLPRGLNFSYFCYSIYMHISCWKIFYRESSM